MVLSKEDTVTIYYYAMEKTDYFGESGAECEKYSGIDVLDYVQNKLTIERKYATIYFKDYKTHCEYEKEPFNVSLLLFERLGDRDIVKELLRNCQGKVN
jgi:hypothetical protein